MNKLVLFRRKAADSEERKRNQMPRRISFIGGASGWPPKVLQKLGEVEGSLWHFKVKLSVWKEKIKVMMEKIDGSLGSSMGLGQLQWCLKELKTLGLLLSSGLLGLIVVLFGGLSLSARNKWFLDL